MTILEQLSKADISAFQKQRDNMQRELATWIRKQNEQIEAMDLVISAAIKLQPDVDVVDAEFTIVDEPGKIAAERLPKSCSKAAAIKQEATVAPEPIEPPIDPRCTDQSLPILDRVTLFLEARRLGTAMHIGTAIGMAQPKDLEALLKANSDLFIKGAGGFWKLK